VPREIRNTQKYSGAVEIRVSACCTEMLLVVSSGGALWPSCKQLERSGRMSMLLSSVIWLEGRFFMQRQLKDVDHD